MRNFVFVSKCLGNLLFDDICREVLVKRIKY